MTNLAALDSSLASTVAVRVYRGGYTLAPASGEGTTAERAGFKALLPSGDPLLVTSDPADLLSLRQALSPTKLFDSSCMCNGDLGFEFLQDRNTVVEVLRFDHPDQIEWPR